MKNYKWLSTIIIFIFCSLGIHIAYSKELKHIQSEWAQKVHDYADQQLIDKLKDENIPHIERINVIHEAGRRGLIEAKDELNLKELVFHRLMTVVG